MSLKIDKNNIYFMHPKNRDFKEINGYDFMIKDFTLFVRVKVDESELQEMDSFIISRNGAHSGISILTDKYHYNYYIQFTYWFWEKNNRNAEIQVKQIQHQIEEDDLNNFNDIYIVNDSINSKINCYYNKELVGVMDYDGFTLADYDESQYWFGAPNMVNPDNHPIGKFEYDLTFCIRKNLNTDTIYDIIENYKTNYLEVIFDDFEIFKRDWELTKDFYFFYDFKDRNRYKFWNYAFNGNYLQLFTNKNNLNY
jgi:hypothetical protein